MSSQSADTNESLRILSASCQWNLQSAIPSESANHFCELSAYLCGAVCCSTFATIWPAVCLLHVNGNCRLRFLVNQRIISANCLRICVVLCVAVYCNYLTQCCVLQYNASIWLCTAERWGAGVETQKNVRGEIRGWGRVPFNETYAPSLSTIYDGA